MSHSNELFLDEVKRQERERIIKIIYNFSRNNLQNTLAHKFADLFIQEIDRLSVKK